MYAAVKNIVQKTYAYVGDVFFPQNCVGCNQPINYYESPIAEHEKVHVCTTCLTDLQQTFFEQMTTNSVLQMLQVRTYVAEFVSCYYYSKQSNIQKFIHSFKYHKQEAMGLFWGKQMADKLLQTQWINQVDVVLPIPMAKHKQKKRGYNHTVLLAKPIAENLQKPILTNVVVKLENTQSQTKKSRAERWKNIEDSFILTDKSALANKTVLVVDDVLTTGATLEAFTHILHTQAYAKKIFAATLAVTVKA